MNERYSNIVKFLENEGFEITSLNKLQISFKFIDDKELLYAEKVFTKTQENEHSSDEDFKKAWDLKNDCEKKFYPRLKTLVKNLSEFYKNRETEYRYQIFLNSADLSVLSLGALELSIDYFNNNLEFENKIEKEFEDFNNFLKF